MSTHVAIRSHFNATKLMNESYILGKCPRCPISSLVPRPHPQKEESIWYTSRAFLGAQDAAHHVTVVTTHRFGIAMHQPLSQTAIAGYSTVSHDNHI